MQSHKGMILEYETYIYCSTTYRTICCTLAPGSAVFSTRFLPSYAGMWVSGAKTVVWVRAGIHAPTKSVSAPAAISVVLILHVIFMARQYKGTIVHGYQDNHRHGVMQATPSINTPDCCAEPVRIRLPCDMTFCSIFGEDRCLPLFVFVSGVSCIV